MWRPHLSGARLAVTLVAISGLCVIALEAAIELDRLRRAVAHSRARGVDVILVIPPMSDLEIDVIRQMGQWEAFLQWKSDLLAAGGYWDFSGYNSIAQNRTLFSDASHVRPVVGHTILRHLLGEECPACGEEAQRIIEAGEWVDQTTLVAHLAEQETQRATWLGQHGDRASLVRTMVERRLPMTAEIQEGQRAALHHAPEAAQ
jgi:hypothetical protein